MARYRLLHVRLHADEKVRLLSPPPPNAQTLWVWLLTGPLTTQIPGVIPHDDATMASRLNWQLERRVTDDDGWPEGFDARSRERWETQCRTQSPTLCPGQYPTQYPKSFREAWAQVEKLGLAIADWTAPLVYIPNAIRHQGPRNPSVVEGWSDTWEDEVPECELKHRIWRDFREIFGTKKRTFLDAFLQACPEPRPHSPGHSAGHNAGDSVAHNPRHQEAGSRKQEAGTTEEVPTPTPPTPGTLSAPPSGTDPAPLRVEKASLRSAVDLVWSHYLDWHDRHHRQKNGQSPPRPKLGAQRRKLIIQRLKDGYDTEEICSAISEMFQTPHNLGENDRGREYLGIEIALRVNRETNNLERFRDAAANRVKTRKGPDLDPHSPGRHGTESPGGRKYDSRSASWVDAEDWTPLTPEELAHAAH